MLVPSGAVVKQFVQTSLHKLLARVGAAYEFASPMPRDNVSRGRLKLECD